MVSQGSRCVLKPGPGYTGGSKPSPRQAARQAAGTGGTDWDGQDGGYRGRAKRKRNRKGGCPELKFLGPQGKVLATGLRQSISWLADVYDDKEQACENVQRIWEQLADFVAEEAVTDNPKKFGGAVYGAPGPLRYKYMWPGLLFFLSLLSSDDVQFLAELLSSDYQSFKSIVLKDANGKDFKETQNLQCHLSLHRAIAKPRDATDLASKILKAAGQVLKAAKKRRSDVGVKQMAPFYRLVVELDEAHRGLSLADHTLKNCVQHLKVKVEEHDKQIAWMLAVEKQALRSGDYIKYKKRKFLQSEGDDAEPDAEP